MDTAWLTPKTEQAPAALGQLFGCTVPAFRLHHGASPREVMLDATAGLNEVDQRGHASFSLIRFIPECPRHAGTTRPAVAADKCRRANTSTRWEYIGT